MESFVGRWNFLSINNVEAFIEAAGDSFREEMKPLVLQARPDLEYDKDGQLCTLKVIFSPEYTKEFHFFLGQPFDTTTIDGTFVKSLVEIDNEKIIEVHKGASKESKIVREVQGDQLISTMELNGVVCTSIHTKAS